ncbi:MAG TPA: Sec-independent protein translocase protein TatB, partial [Ilumatobacteraceae bacterium]
NLSGSEIVFLLLIALIVLGPEKLPDAVRKFGKIYAEFKKMSTGFQSELKTALDEPMREMRETAEAIKKAASFDIDADLGSDPVIEPDEPPVAAEPKSLAAGAAASTDADAEAVELDAETPPPAAAPVDPIDLDAYDEPSYGSNIIDAADEKRPE